MAEEDDQKGYRWESEYEKTWEIIKEDDKGFLDTNFADLVQQAKRKRLLNKKGNVRLGMMRHLYVIIDMSNAMNDQDLKPTRLLCVLKLLQMFTEEYFDQNPISQIGFIATRNKRVEKLSELAGNPKRHIDILKKSEKFACSGEPSLQNSLELAATTMRHMPSHSSREILIIFGSLTTCDPGDIEETIGDLKKNNIRCSIIGLAAELRICKHICHVTKGTYNVILDEHHLKDLIYQHTEPVSATINTESSLVRMGKQTTSSFPNHRLASDENSTPAMCSCHFDSKDGEGFGTSGYFCPQCNSKYCELPVECKACNLTLVSAPQLARSYHHLFPIPNFQEVLKSQLPENTV
ncbi:General transcription factor IIH subunit 2 [Nymphon striatum]|nr:General transcription factor IIH subunit 2 [Nymphon striatum]